MRRIALAALGALALAACGGREVALPTPSTPPPPSATTTSPTPPPAEPGSPTPAPQVDLQVPRDAPTVLAERADVADLRAAGYAPLLPPGAVALEARAAEARVFQIAVSWYRGEDPFARQSGLVVWQRFADPPAWRAVYAFTDRPGSGVLGISVEQQDLTGDGAPDLLTREDRGGTGACAIWRVVASSPGDAREVWRLDGCDTVVGISRGRLEVREAVYGPDDPHCCPSAFLVRTLAWDGKTFAETQVRTLMP